MKTLRNPFLLAATAICAAIILLTGCMTVPDGTKPNNKIKGVAYIGTATVLKKHPEYRAGFLQAAADLTTIEQADPIDFTTVLEIVNRLPVKELQGDDAMIYITGVTILLEDFTNVQLDLSKTPQLRSAVIGLRQGIELGLGGKPAPALRPFTAVPAPSNSPN